MGTLTAIVFADWATIAQIVVDIVLGGILAYILAAVVPKKINNERALKDFYMHELEDLMNDYNEFCREISQGHLGAVAIKDKFKRFSMKLQSIEDSANKELNVNISVSSKVTAAQQYLTGSDDMNDQYDETRITFSPKVIKELDRYLLQFNRSIYSDIAWINKASLR